MIPFMKRSNQTPTRKAAETIYTKDKSHYAGICLAGLAGLAVLGGVATAGGTMFFGNTALLEVRAIESTKNLATRVNVFNEAVEIEVNLSNHKSKRGAGEGADESMFQPESNDLTSGSNALTSVSNDQTSGSNAIIIEVSTKVIPTNAKSLNLRDTLDISSEELEPYLVGRLKGEAEMLLKMQDKYKVNVAFAIAVARAETSMGDAGNGKKEMNNLFNIRDFKTRQGKYAIYETLTDGTEAFFKLIDSGYLNDENSLFSGYAIADIGKKYAESKTWTSTIEGYTQDVLVQLKQARAQNI